MTDELSSDWRGIAKDLQACLAQSSTSTGHFISRFLVWICSKNVGRASCLMGKASSCEVIQTLTTALGGSTPPWLVLRFCLSCFPPSSRDGRVMMRKSC